MDSRDITQWQARRIQESLDPAHRFLSKLKQRMEQQKFPQHDSLYRDVCRAYDALQSVWLDFHYLSCGSGVGLPPRRPAGSESEQT